MGFSAWADTFKDRNTIYKIIFIMSIALTGATILTHGIENKIVVLCVALLIAVNAGYGGGFSNVPTLLSDHFGMKSISAVHGMCLSAWAVAGLTGNQMATAICYGSFIRCRSYRLLRSCKAYEEGKSSSLITADRQQHPLRSAA